MRFVLSLGNKIEFMIFGLVAAQVECSEWNGQQQEPPRALDYTDSQVNERYHVFDGQELFKQNYSDG